LAQFDTAASTLYKKAFLNDIGLALKSFYLENFQRLFFYTRNVELRKWFIYR